MDFADPPIMSSGNFDPFEQEHRDSAMPRDLGLDPSDPLNLLLNNSSQDSSMEDSSSSHGSPPDWSQLSSSFWPNQGENMKPYPDLGMDFLQMDMDFNPSMAVDPNSLHYTNGVYDLNQHLSNEFMPASFPFTFNAHPSPEDPVTGTGFVKSSDSSSSESSSSRASLSPVPEPTSAVDELAQQVRQTAGVMLAVPSGSQYQQPKLPIPRLPTQPKLATKPKRAPIQLASGAASSATSSPSPEDSASLTMASMPATTTSVISRPKTSHTTIERRYRTNLNARIQSLRQAVPALRVLEEKNKRVKQDGDSDGNEKEKTAVDVVDERGFVDGVKVARKGSKANVLGKAVEYIRVLKKREARLKREQNGLKSLIGGLVGGPALLKEWEHEWRAKFGGEERDEIEGEEAEPMSDDEDGDEEGDGDEDEGRAKKKAKIVKMSKKETLKKAPAPVLGDSTMLPEKRKRGRPRKVQVPTSSPEDNSSLIPSGELVVQPPMTQDTQGQPAPVQQYLLATFALFSFFNSPLTSSSTFQTYPHSHSGSVLGHLPVAHSETSVIAYSYGWRELIQAFHLTVSALVFFSIVMPWLPETIKHTRLASVLLSPFPQFTSPVSPPQLSSAPLSPSPSDDRVTLLSALAHSRRGASDEADQLHSALGVPSGVLGLIMSWRRSGGQGFERKGLEQRAWVRLGELVALDGTTSTATRLQTYWCMRSHISYFKASTSDLSTLALILRSLSSAKANALWSRAEKTEFVRPYERLVLSNLTLEDAAEQLAAIQHDHESAQHAPIRLLATTLVRQRLLKHTSLLFVRTVLPAHNQNGTEDSWVYTEQDHLEEKKLKETIDAGKSLGGRTRMFAEALEKVWGTGIDDVEDILDDDDIKLDAVEVEIRALLSALILYRRIFPSSILSCGNAAGVEPISFILSPPPSPSRKNADLHLALRRALASDVFDFKGDDAEDEILTKEQRLGITLEDARDRVVDMLVEGERAGRSRASNSC